MSEHLCGNCGGGCGGCCCRPTQAPVLLNKEQKEFLLELTLHNYLPLTRFIRTNSQNDEIYIVALEPVYLITTADSLETAKETGRFLREMEAAGLITLDYGSPLDGYPYLEYYSSSVYAYFVETVQKGAQHSSEFLGDTPHLELGSIAITPLGSQSLEIS